MIKNNKTDLLNANQYIICESLQNTLEKEQLDINSPFYNTFFYLVVFRLLNVNKLDVVYNFISYNYLFLPSLVDYLLMRNNADFYTEPGYFLTVMQNM